MGDFMQTNHNYWNNEGDHFESPEFSQFHNQLDFQSNEDYYTQYPPSGIYNPYMYENMAKSNNAVPGDDLDEPPLLEELEIYPDRILEKVLAVLNPFRAHSLADDSEYLTKEADLAGPIFFCVLLAVSLFCSGNKAHFSYIYGISVISCILMYLLLSLMSPSTANFTFFTVASILGYCLIPVVGLSFLALILRLRVGLVSFGLSFIAVAWASLSASRLFIAVSGDRDQQPLIAYPCALVYGVYVLLVLF